MHTSKKKKYFNEKMARRIKRSRAKIFGTSIRPRLSVYKSLLHCSVQIIDDEEGRTLASASDKEISQKGKKTEKAFAVGELIAKKAAEKKIKKVVYDRHGSAYHGRIRAIAEGARKHGLEF